MIAQVLYFKLLKRLQYIISLFRFSRLRCSQWRSNPAAPIASFIAHAYKRRSVLSAQNADVAQTLVGVTYLRSKKMCKQTHVLYRFTTDTFVHGKQKEQNALYCVVNAKH